MLINNNILHNYQIEPAKQDKKQNYATKMLKDKKFLAAVSTISILTVASLILKNSKLTKKIQGKARNFIEKNTKFCTKNVGNRIKELSNNGKIMLKTLGKKIERKLYKNRKKIDGFFAVTEILIDVL